MLRYHQGRRFSVIIGGTTEALQAPRSRRRGVKGEEWEGVSPSPAGSLGEHCELPQQGPGQCPVRKRIFVHFEPNSVATSDVNIDFFVNPDIES